MPRFAIWVGLSVLSAGCSSTSVNSGESTGGAAGQGGAAAGTSVGGAGGSAVSGGNAGKGGGPNCPSLGEKGTFPSPAARVLDDFNRADGPIGGSWTGYSIPLIEANSLVYPESAWGSLLYTERLCPDQEVYVTAKSVDHVGQVVLQLKMQEPEVDCEQLEVVFDMEVNLMKVHHCAGGTWQDAGQSVPVTVKSGDVIGARARASGEVEVYKGGVLLEEVTVGAWVHAASDGYPGLEAHVLAGKLALDDFGGGG